MAVAPRLLRRAHAVAAKEIAARVKGGARSVVVTQIHPVGDEDMRLAVVSDIGERTEIVIRGRK